MDQKLQKRKGNIFEFKNSQNTLLNVFRKQQQQQQQQWAGASNL